MYAVWMAVEGSAERLRTWDVVVICRERGIGRREEEKIEYGTFTS